MANQEYILEQIKKDCYENSTDKYYENATEADGIFCEKIFDGLMCWPKTKAGTIAYQLCNNGILKSVLKGNATKYCTKSGKWFSQESNTNNSWTNYTQCGDFLIGNPNITMDMNISDDHQIYLNWLPRLKYITNFGYILSIASLIIALIIFINIKRLHCARNKLHMHLFISFVLRALMSLIKDGLFVGGTALFFETKYEDGIPIFNKENNSWLCKGIVTLRHYFIISNYMFLLMEGTYLHNLMFLNLFSENGVMVYCFLGWVLPLPFIMLWVIFKFYNEDLYCWTQIGNKYITALIEIPIGLSVIINFILFIRIMRVLVVKLTSMYIQQRRLKYQKLLRSTLILVPLFGIPYIISLILRLYVSKSQMLEILWLYFDQSFTALQGFFASLVYCLMNNEVQMEIRRKYHSFKDRNNREFKRSRTISHTQQVTFNEEMQDL